MDTLAEVLVTNRAGTVTTRITATHVVQIGEGRNGHSYASIPIPQISSLKVKSRALPFWLVAAGMLVIGAIVTIQTSLNQQDPAFVMAAILLSGLAWYCFKQWQQTRDERLVVASSSGELVIERISTVEHSLLDLVDVLEERQGLSVR